MPFPHAEDKRSLLKEKPPFFPIQFFQMLTGYKKREVSFVAKGKKKNE